jgi:tetratricopeptide (TPR) repeat protein
MPTGRTDNPRDFASCLLASRQGPIRACRRPGQRFGTALFALVCAGALSGCGFGVFGGGPEPARVEPQDAPKADVFAQTRAHMQAAPNEPYWAFHLGELYVVADSTAAAIRSLNAALAVDADYAPAVSLLSKIYYDVKMYPQAVALLEAYLSRHADAPDALRAGLALHYEAMNDGDKADAALKSCAADAPDAQNARVLAWLRHNDAAGMLDASKRALDDNKSAANYNNYGIALLASGRPAEARDAFRSALNIDGALPGALYNMAIVESFYFFDDGAGRDWYTRYLRVASDDPDNLKAHFESDVSSTEPAGH